MHRLTINPFSILPVVMMTGLLVGLCGCSDDPDTQAPTIMFQNLSQDLLITEAFTVALDVRDDVGVDYVWLFVDGAVIDERASAPWLMEWPMGLWADGQPHQVWARADDAAGNIGYSDTLQVTVSVQVQTAPQPLHPAQGMQTEPESTLFRWLSFAGTDSYRLQLSPREDFSHLVFETTVEDTTYQLEEELPGVFFWRLAAEIAGEDPIWSRPLRFHNVATFFRIYPAPSGSFLGTAVERTSGDRILMTSCAWFMSESAAYIQILDADGQQIRNPMRFNSRSINRWNSSCRSHGGGVVFAGNTSGRSAGETDAWVVALDADGQFLGEQTFGDERTEWVNGIAPTADGGYVLVGCVRDSSSGETDHDVLVIRTDGSFQEIWARRFGEASGTEIGNGVVELPGGDLLVAGGSETFGAGQDVAFLMRLDPQGEPSWTRTYLPGGGPGWGTGLIELPAGHYAMYGYTGISYDSPPFIAAYDEDGMEIWAADVPGEARALFNGVNLAVAAVEDGGCLFWCRVLFDDSYRIIKFSGEDGALQWSSAFPVVTQVNTAGDGTFLLPSFDGPFADSPRTPALYKVDEYGNYWAAQKSGYGGTGWRRGLAAGQGDPSGLTGSSPWGPFR